MFEGVFNWISFSHLKRVFFRLILYIFSLKTDCILNCLQFLIRNKTFPCGCNHSKHKFEFVKSVRCRHKIPLEIGSFFDLRHPWWSNKNCHQHTASHSFCQNWIEVTALLKHFYQTILLVNMLYKFFRPGQQFLAGI